MQSSEIWFTLWSSSYLKGESVCPKACISDTSFDTLETQKDQKYTTLFIEQVEPFISCLHLIFERYVILHFNMPFYVFFS